MKCACLLFLSFLCLFAAAQTEADYLKQAQASLPANTKKALLLADKAFALALQKENHAVAAHAGALGAAALRSSGDVLLLLQHDSLSLAAARKTGHSLLVFDALVAYAKDLIESNRIQPADKLLSEAATLISEGDKKRSAAWHQVYGNASFKAFRTNDALGHYIKGRAIADELGDEHLATIFKMQVGQAVLFKGKPDSMHLVYAALDYFDRSRDLIQASKACNIIGFGFKVASNPDKALLYYSKALAYAQKGKESRMAATMNIEIAEMLTVKKEYGRAENLLTNCVSFFSRIRDYSGGALAKIRLGMLYTDKDLFSKAEQAFNEAEALSVRLQNERIKAGIVMCRIKLASKMKNGVAVDSLSLASLALLNKSMDRDLIQNAKQKYMEGAGGISEKESRQIDSVFNPRLFAAVAKNNTARTVLGSDSQQLAHLNIYSGKPVHEDSSVLAMANRQLMDLETKYKTRQISDSLKLEKQRAALAGAELKRRNLVLLASGALLVLLAAGFWLQYHYRRQAERDKTQIELLQHEIHHRVKNNLGVITRLVEVAGKNAVDEIPLSSLKTRIKSIELLHRHLCREGSQPGQIQLQPYLEDLCTAVAATFETGRDIQIKVAAPVEVDSSVAEKLGLIVNELVTNCYKYAFEDREGGEIMVRAHYKNKQEVQVAVEDNGKGFEEGESRPSYGMKLIRGLSHELKGRFAFHNSGGTHFQLEIPV